MQSEMSEDREGSIPFKGRWQGTHWNTFAGGWFRWVMGRYAGGWQVWILVKCGLKWKLLCWTHMITRLQCRLYIVRTFIFLRSNRNVIAKRFPAPSDN